MAKLLFLRKLSRADILTRVEFLTTGVGEPDKDNNKKLSRVINYLQIIHNLVLTLELDGSGTVKWWVEAAFSVHHNMKSHTGGSMSMGKGGVYSAYI